jgi:hypothetical protein
MSFFSSKKDGRHPSQKEKKKKSQACKPIFADPSMLPFYLIGKACWPLDLNLD